MSQIYKIEKEKENNKRTDMKIKNYKILALLAVLVIGIVLTSGVILTSGVMEKELATVDCDSGVIEEAEKEFKKATRINPKLTEAHNNLAVLLSKEADKEFEKAKELKSYL